MSEEEENEELFNLLMVELSEILKHDNIPASFVLNIMSKRYLTSVAEFLSSLLEHNENLEEKNNITEEDFKEFLEKVVEDEESG